MIVCNASVTLFRSSTQRLFFFCRLSAELYYVRNGVLNDYALNFEVMVPAEIKELHFTWQSLAGRPLPYAISVQHSKPEAMHPAFLNISTSGTIPTSTQTFCVALPCSGDASAEVDTVISINVTLNRATNNVTRLNFKRRKICLLGHRHHFPQNDGSASPGGSSRQGMASPGRGEDESAAMYIAISSACALATLLAIALLACYLRSNKSGMHNSSLIRESRLGSSSSGGPFLAPVPVMSCGGSSSGSCASSRPRTAASSNFPATNPADLHHRIAQLTIQRCRVRLKSVVLEGTFGRVYRGSYTEEDGLEEEVLVKTVTDQASSIQVSLLLQEGMAMYGLSHKNILSILGVSIEDHTAPFLIYPHQGYTNLKRFLQKCKLTPEGVAHTLTTQEVVDMALQIISGMLYLHKKRLLHKDLAARNCVIDDKLRVQIADNALARDLFPADYHCLGDNENRPVKWLAIESLTQKQFTTASDVWSFGVLLWELTTLAQQPYVEIDPFEIPEYLRDGYRLAQPVNCPDELFGVMAYCWAMSPDDRPTFPQLQVCLQEFYTQLTRYV
ncbi:determination of muscle attachment site [Nesidiocoris tenuis]|uniref:Determination of muscle attachment site n=1 Tax=Nesidiocoris tenuis TaxID=355587 RepID=A0ABN7AI07_9HEMI|nr:determination of muscle attachment site [Nesidiocoris tenuis]